MVTSAAVRVAPGVRVGLAFLRAVLPVVVPFPKENRVGPAPDVREYTLEVATRHGDVRVLVYEPVTADGRGPLPIYVNIHGGTFTVRHPESDEHICRRIARETGSVVVNIDYDTAPGHLYPVAEEECFDVVSWSVSQAAARGWDADRIVVGGFSAGAKLALNVAQLNRDEHSFELRGVVVVFPILDMTIPVDARTSPKKNPVGRPWTTRLIYEGYFADSSRRGEPLASPRLDPDLGKLPPILLLSGDLDILSAEANDFERLVTAAGGELTHRRFAASDHGFTHTRPADVGRQAVSDIITFVTERTG
jgi:acetyl esterase